MPSNYCGIDKTLPLASFKVITDFELIVNIPEMVCDWRFCFIDDLSYRVNTQEDGLFFSPVLIGTERPMASTKFAVEQWQLKNQVQIDSSSSAVTVLTANSVDIIWRSVPIYWYYEGSTDRTRSRQLICVNGHWSWIALSLICKSHRNQ